MLRHYLYLIIATGVLCFPTSSAVAQPDTPKPADPQPAASTAEPQKTENIKKTKWIETF